MSRRQTVNTTGSTPNYCCLFCLQKHGTIQKTWGGYIVKKVLRQKTQYVHKCIGLTKHIKQNQECATFYSSKGLTRNRVINVSSSMLGNPITHQTLHNPSSFGLSTTGNAPAVARHPQVPSLTQARSIPRCLKKSKLKFIPLIFFIAHHYFQLP